MQAVYKSASESRLRGGIWLDNSEAEPAPRQGICIWDLRTGTRELVPVALSEGTVITSLVWGSSDQLLCLASRIGRGDLDYPAKTGILHWPSAFRYPILQKDLVAYRLQSRETSVLLSHLKANWGMEPRRGNSGGATLWEYLVPSNKLSYMTVTTDGALGARVTLPPADRDGDPPATARTRVPVTVRKDPRRPHTDAQCLARADGDHYQDFYRPGRYVGGVFGSPDGERVAFLEDSGDGRSSVHMDLKVVALNGGHAEIVARDAWQWSYVAWSPDGTKIAYVRAQDGRIVVADVPRSRA